ncbi:MAG TPA: EamA family transporter [Azospirillum sp.]|nr:EamA family transporter [Azospirillum sp.]
MVIQAEYALVLAAAVGHAGWNALLKASGDRLLSLAAIRLIGLLLGVAVLPFVPMPAPESWGLLAGAAAVHFVYFWLLLNAYRVGDLSVVHPVSRGMAPLLLAALAWLAVGERLAPAHMAAVAAISGGIGVLAVKGGASRQAVAFALGTGVTVAMYSFLGALGVRAAGTVVGFQAWLEIFTGVGVLTVAAAHRPLASVEAYARTQGGTGVVAGLLSVGGYTAYLFAVAALPMAAVSALRESSVLFAALIGTVFYKEGFGLRRVLAAALVTGGIVMLGIAK